MGEAWKGHHREKGDPTLNQMHDLHIIRMKGDMTMQEKAALQLALAVHVYLATRKQPMDAIDFVHPWASKHIDKKEVMNKWFEVKDGKSNSDRLADFIESLTTDEAVASVDIVKTESREDVLEKMHIDLTPVPDTQAPESGATVH